MASLIDDRTRLIVVINPSNPCGSVYTKEQLEAILDGKCGGDGVVMMVILAVHDDGGGNDGGDDDGVVVIVVVYGGGGGSGNGSGNGGGNDGHDGTCGGDGDHNSAW